MSNSIPSSEQAGNNGDLSGSGDGCCSTSPSSSSSSGLSRRATFASCASLTLATTASSFLSTSSSSSGKKGVEILPLGFEASGSNGGSRRGSSSSSGGGGGGGGGSGRRKQHQQPAATTKQQQQQRLQKRYAWDGNKVIALEGDDEDDEEESTKSGSSSSSNGEQRQHQKKNKLHLFAARRSLEQALDACSRSFFPDPASVSPDYWAYCRWRGAHRLCSSMLSNFATQALLAAVGVGASRSLPAAAGINWLLKDGLGRVGRLGVATRFGEAFDADIKRFRFATSVLFTASVGLELATPAFPRQFLALAAAANVGKAVGLTTYISTQPSFGASFARGGTNLADVTAKAQAQQMVVDTLGLALCVGTLRGVGVKAAAAGARAGVAASFASSSSVSATAAATGEAAAAAAAKSASAAFRRSFGGGVPPALLALLAAGDLFCIARELKSVHLRTLNRERAELAAEAWLAGRRRRSGSGGDDEGRSEGEGGRGILGRWMRRGGGGASSEVPAPPAPSPEEIAEAEPLLFPARPGSGLLPLRFSRLEDAGVTSKRELDDALGRRLKGNDKFLLVRVGASDEEASEKKKKKKKRKKQCPGSSSLRLVLRSDAKSSDALVGVLAAAHARAEILEQQQQQQQQQEQEQRNKKGSGGGSSGGDGHDSAEKQRLLLSRATAAARRDGPAFYEALEDAGWQMEPFLLSPRERGGLVVLG